MRRKVASPVMAVRMEIELAFLMVIAGGQLSDFRI